MMAMLNYNVINMETISILIEGLEKRGEIHIFLRMPSIFLIIPLEANQETSRSLFAARFLLLTGRF